MTHTTRSLLTCCLIATLLWPAVTAAQPDKKIAKKVDIKVLSEKLDNLYRADSSRARMTMQITTPHYERTLEMEMITKGSENTLIRILSPRKERGISTLKRGNEMWNYLPKVKKTVRVPPSMISSSWMGSDVTNDDLVRDSSWEEDYTVEQVPADDSEFCFDYTPKEDAPVTWSKVHTCFDATYELPKLQEFYDEKGRQVRKMIFDQYKKVDGRVIPTRTTIIPLSEGKQGHKTVMTYTAMSFDVPIEDDTFSLANLRRGK